VHEESAAV